MAFRATIVREITLLVAVHRLNTLGLGCNASRLVADHRVIRDLWLIKLFMLLCHDVPTAGDAIFRSTYRAPVFHRGILKRAMRGVKLFYTDGNGVIYIADNITLFDMGASMKLSGGNYTESTPCRK
ncbi:hypothetical protein L873DRAFT_1818901 [Choiromyces venosus 120613-1]|uniref:Uncharacterized protein n=1 Tax=Choiromyces venosus 120613-1 TaxID=1336337 RepID=A0A3N4IZZ2_9PEZI|nr:hypothetical protein L873DRAFT_1818901 [Choiromyces venosus 120613-1]